VIIFDKSFIERGMHVTSGTKDNEKEIAIIEPVDNAPMAVQNAEKNTQNNKSSSTTNISSQKQLLGLAKKFALDGALIPDEKQAPIEDRSYRRKKLSELRKQQNMETIISRAIQYCSDSRIADRADHDWFSSFVNLAEDISNKTMQDLWAKILAGEVSKPGSFSLKTLQAFRSMSIAEAKLFAKVCSLAVSDSRKKNMRIITGAYQIPKLLNFFNKSRIQKLGLAQVGFSYADLLTLADNHLIFEQETESMPFDKNENIQFQYNGETLNITAKKHDCLLTFYKLTPIGTELAYLIGDNVNQDYLTSLTTQLSENFSINTN
jgi:uncharacterized repeat protein (TIGR03899 family)